MKPRMLAFELALALLLVQECRSPGAARATSAAEESPLARLRAEFRPAYAAEREQVDADLSPLIVARFSDLFLIKNGEVIAEGQGAPEKFHLLHRTAHVPFVIYLKLRRCFDRALDETVAADVAGYRKLLDAAATDLTAYGFTPEEIAWQEALLRESAAFLDLARPGAVVSREAFEDYRSRIHQPMMKLADVAGAAQVDGTHAVVSAWRRKHLNEDEWNRVRVVIVGTRQPRHDYAATQYFATLFPERGNSLFPGESNRVFYVESLAIDPEDRDFEKERRAVASLLLDEMAAEAIFHDPYRLSMDVVADGARRRIRELDRVSAQPPSRP